MTKGFGLIEIMIGIAISSIVSIALFNTLFQIQNSEIEVGEIASVGIRVSILSDRLQKDLTGIFWPNFSEKDFGAKNKKIVGRKDAQESNQSTKFSLAKVLFSENQSSDGDTHLKQFTFVTDNPLQVYDESKPRVARVIYTLEAEKENYFSLFRQEGQDLDFKEVLEDAQKYELVGGIKSINFIYFYQDPKSEQNQNGAEDLVELKELDFGTDQLQVEDDKPSFEEQVPKYIKVEVSLWSSDKQSDFKDFEFWFYINSFAQESKKDQSGGSEK